MQWDNLLNSGFKGEIRTDEAHRQLYATDASIYREKPVAVAFPKNAHDLICLVNFCTEQKISIIPRGAGTSLAGQCVGAGVVVDVSRHLNQAIELNLEEGFAVVEPGLVRDELNRLLKDSDWMFGPNTSTSNRATIGGMVGNNSSGTTSVSYGVTRDKVLELEVVLSDGSLVNFSSKGATQINKQANAFVLPAITEYFEKRNSSTVLFSEIQKQYPHPEVHRRNTGYALDYLFNSKNKKNNIADWTKIICGSEGTLCFISKIKIKLDRKPPAFGSVIVSHFSHLNDALNYVPDLLKCEGIYMLELMDDTILDCARQSESQKDNLFFIQSDPKALLMTEIRADTEEEHRRRLDVILNDSQTNPALYANTIVQNNDIHRVWALRAAGLGVLSNIAGDKVALACIEDTAVHTDVLAEYIATFSQLMKQHGQEAIYYAHAGAGELHLRPVLDLKSKEGREDFVSICNASAELVKKYNGSLSGEHGDGRVRAPFIKEFYGEKIYNQFIQLKKAFDPHNLFNPGKIVGAKDLLDDLRFELKNNNPESNSIYNYQPDQSILHHAERCNGSGDCRKSHALSPGMCPTFQATGREIHSTRARANLIREALSANNENQLVQPELKESMSSCLACKACKSECPSGVDVSLLKSEYLHQTRKAGKKSMRDYLLAHPELTYRLNKYLPLPSRLVNSGGLKWIFNLLGFAKERAIPLPARRSLIEILKKRRVDQPSESALIRNLSKNKKIVLAVDEFVNYFDLSAGLATYKLLNLLGYEIEVFAYNSGRALISKGYLEKAEQLAVKNVALFNAKLSSAHTIVGLEPSALLSFRDEYHRFKSTANDKVLTDVNKSTFLFSEFLLNEISIGAINLSQLDFRRDVHILQHVHCHQRALSEVQSVSQLFNTIPSWICEQINTGCCGMAGGFGYEAEHFELSQQVANLGLFPSITSHPDHYIVASGMSCRHQIRDGVQRKARHPAELILKFLEY